MVARYRVLVVDDNDKLRTALTELIGAAADFEVVGAAEDGVAAIEAVERFRPDVVLMDIKMPNMDGIEATRRIRASDSSVAVIAHTAYEDAGLVSDMVKAGAKGYLVKGVDARALFDGIRSAVAGDSRISATSMRVLFDEVESSAARERVAAARLETVVAVLRDRGRADPLTGLLERRHLQDELERLLAGSLRTGGTLALLVVRVEDLRALNRHWGWAVGDAALVHAARALHAVDVSEVVLGRGSDHVLAAAPGVDAAHARRLAAAVLRAAADPPFRTDAPLRLHAGIAVHPGAGVDAEELLVAARAASFTTSSGAAPSGGSGMLIGEAQTSTYVDTHTLALVDAAIETLTINRFDAASAIRRTGAIAAALCDVLGRPAAVNAARLGALLAALSRDIDAGGFANPAVARLAGIAAGADVAEVVSGAGVRWDAGGASLPIAGRVAAVALAYVTARRAGLDRDAAAAQVAQWAGTVLDPEVTNALPLAFDAAEVT